MALASKQCIATALVHMKAKRKWKPLNYEIGQAYSNDDRLTVDYFTPIYYNVIKSDGQMMWKPYELYILRTSKITPAGLRGLLQKP
jgi:hypothetical protein